MHVEKNILDMVLGSVLDIKGKMKDTLNGRRELMRMKIRKELHPRRKGDNMYELPPTCYTLTSSERHRFIDVLKRIKVLDGYQYISVYQC